MNVAEIHPEKENFCHNVNCELMSESDCINLELDSLFDTGSAVSFLKIKFVPQHIMCNPKGSSSQFVVLMILD